MNDIDIDFILQIKDELIAALQVDDPPLSSTVEFGSYFITSTTDASLLSPDVPVRDTAKLVANSSNGGDIYLASEKVLCFDKYTRFVLDAGETLELSVANLNVIYVAGSNVGDFISWACEQI